MQAWLGKSLIVIGIVCLIVGAVLLLAPKVPWLGKLPGDIRVPGERVTFYFPLATCIVVSIVLTILLNLLLRR